MNIQLSKCWLAKGGILVFQASAFDPATSSRHKGFLILDPASAEPIRFAHEKPEGTLSSDGVAALIRKLMPSGRIAGLALSSDNHTSGFACLRLDTSSDASGTIHIFIVNRPERMIDIVAGDASYARLTPSNQFTARRAAVLAVSEEEMIPPVGFRIWTDQLIGAGEQHEDTRHDESSAPKELSPARKVARDKVSRRLRTLRKTILETEKHLPTLLQLEEAKLHADILRQYLWMIKPGDFELRLPEPVSGITRVPLDPDKTPGGNAEELFVKKNKLERAFSLQNDRLRRLSSDEAALERGLYRLRDLSARMSDAAVADLLSELGLSARRQNTREAAKSRKPSPGRLFIHPSGARIFVGRDARESDQVVKAAASNDWWIHVAGGGHGSHVIVSGPSVKDQLPDDLERVAGILALHFSDRKQAREGEVYVARRHLIRKKKSMPAGLWLISRASTTLIRYTEQDVSRVFALEARDGIQREVAAHVRTDS